MQNTIYLLYKSAEKILSEFQLNQEIAKFKRQIAHFERQPDTKQRFRILQRLNLELLEHEEKLKELQEQKRIDRQLSEFEDAESAYMEDTWQDILNIIYKVQNNELSEHKAKAELKKKDINLSKFEHLANELGEEETVIFRSLE